MTRDLYNNVYQRYDPSSTEINEQLEILSKKCPLLKPYKNISFEKINVGMNYNYFVKVGESRKYQLKILARKGYPSINKIKATYELLEKVDINYNTLVYASEDIFPYGFFLYDYINGSIPEENWISNFTKVLEEVHSVKLPSFGILDSTFQSSNIYDYYKNIDQAIDASFGSTFIEPYSIWDLVEDEFLDHFFLYDTFSYMYEVAKTLPDTKPHLCHGDMSKNNLLMQDSVIYLVDWDEAKSHIWPSELARLLYYTDTEHHKTLYDKFIKSYPSTLDDTSIKKIITLEHIYQHLRNILIICIGNTKSDALIRIKQKVRQIQLLKV